MLLLVTAHLVLAALLPTVSRWLGRWAFAVGAILPAVSLGWALTSLTEVLAGGTVDESVAWAPVLGLTFTLRLDILSLLMIFLVSGVGVLILCYCVYYFKPDAQSNSRTSALLVAFAGAMLGLVLADDLFTLYIFWELTTVCSFLLVGQDGNTKQQRRSSIQALLVTVLGGLSMLLGFVLLGEQAGTYRISEIVASPPAAGALTSTALVLILLGAFTKSAQVPFHTWLPGAMVAPTPVSAYLHAASMVKAGVYLVARLSPAFSDHTPWWPLIATLGIWTMLIGGYRALFERDLKTLLAYGTVSQLGFLMVLMGAGSHTVAMAGATMLIAHGLFKSTLFLVVGIIDHQAGTRNIDELSGIRRRFPVLTVIGAIGALSMAGIPPLFGFLGKEAAFEGFLESGTTGDLVVLVGLVLGSALTAAYSFRFLWGAFGTKPGVEDSSAPKPSLGLMVPAAVPAALTLLLGVVASLFNALATTYAEPYPAGDHPYYLALWHGFSLPLLLSAVVVASGVGLHLARDRVVRLGGWLPDFLQAQPGYERTVAGLDTVSYAVTGRFQAGSLPTYLAIILLTFVLVPGSAVLTGGSMPEELRLWDSAVQVPVAILVLTAAIAVTMAKRRMTAVILTGVVGYGIGAFFVLDGGPDLALAQFLVETLTLVAFVFVLRRLPSRFTQVESTRSPRWPKVAVSVAAGALVAVSALVFSGARQAPPEASEGFVEAAPEGAHANNVVNAILVDFRAFDTVGEISVLAVAATGVASLILATRRARRPSAAEETEGPRKSREVRK
ncbi:MULTISPECIES: hydrogen gas-evolving membrane-bound hydrogenase subunit E [Actinoalloteichus]|uniref:Multicomponent Na+:H+ antiporter subunit A n=1 Tax=Actinoalloteichus caeruleus DSM 43889 TaxID=1120930 RepID=A0ABT1JMN9_ACTCY|nr:MULTISPECIES: hydrogen gas-evolving membrane-bound hydrogenase subunit E [Actinoalloteichus]MCP2333617.1 multicomponent Na+:H+ antiporter subunit A [Actinoalloteichus caeruleus DSM 43889]